MSLQLNAPQPLASTHLLDEFECGDSQGTEFIVTNLVDVLLLPLMIAFAMGFFVGILIIRFTY